MEKGLSLDSGRKYWSLDFLDRLLRMVAKAGLTHFQFCLGDLSDWQKKDEGSLKVESITKSAYTKDEIRWLMKRCSELDLTLIPCFDTPGHMNKVLSHHPAYALEKADGSRDWNALDVTNEAAIAYAFACWDEVLEAFLGSKLVNLAADEFIPFEELEKYPQMIAEAKTRYGEKASGLELYVDYINRLVERLKARGIRCRIWNDGFFRGDHESLMELTREVDVCYWSNWDQSIAPVKTWLDKGYSLLNFCDNQLYYVLGEAAGYTYPTEEKIEAEFRPALFSGKVRLNSEEMAQVKGCYFSIWCDLPEAQTEAEVLAQVAPLLTSFAHKLEGK